MNKCNGLDRYGNECNKNKLENIDYCIFHEYLINYTQEQLNNLELCNGCLKWKNLEENIKTCEECKTRGKENRIKHKNKKILCKKEDCKFEKSNDNEYCGKHQAHYFLEQTEILGKKVCYNYIRGCREQLNLTYSFSKCENCLKTDREKDKIRRNKNKIIIKGNDEEKNKDDEEKNKDKDEEKNKDKDEENKILMIVSEIELNIQKKQNKINKIINHLKSFMDENNNFVKLNLEIPLIQCSDAKCKLIYLEKYFKSDTNGSITSRCQFCRDKGKIKDHKESRQISKQKWKEENHDKMAKYWMDYRGRKMEELGDEYWKNKAKQMKTWRRNNPEKVKENNEKKKENVNESYKTYKRTAETKNTNFEITLEEYIELVINVCFYCGEIDEKGFNGIDKMICTNGYVLDNIVPCCEICNVMKGTLTPEIFFKRIEHILTYQEIINGNLYPNVFKNYKPIFEDYRYRAINRLKKKFDITKDEFNQIIYDECYLCGKETNETHKNGIDRIDNNLEYIKTNIKSCCGNCNFMKNEYDLEELLKKMLLIYDNLKEYKFNDKKNIIEHKYKHLDKKTSEEKVKALNEKRKIQKEEMILKYNDNEFKKNKAIELALLRK
jgi:hypothetical protein